jgi:uncharacterized protein (DUF983 family)
MVETEAALVVGAAAAQLRAMNESRIYPPQEPVPVGLKCRCPRCGEGRLFAGYLSIAEQCERCGLDFAFADSGDGPAVFAIFIVGFLVAGGALFLEVAWQPPWWVHVAVWGPLVIGLSLGCLRPLKGLAVALQYCNRAQEGELDRPL